MKNQSLKHDFCRNKKRLQCSEILRMIVEVELHVYLHFNKKHLLTACPHILELCSSLNSFTCITECHGINSS